MPEQLHFPWISLSLAALLVAAAAAWRQNNSDRARTLAVSALAANLVLLLLASLDAWQQGNAHAHLEPWGGSFLTGWFAIDVFNGVPLPLFATLSLGITISAPRRKVTPRWLSGVLLLTAATSAAYAADNLAVLAAGWAAAALPFLTRRFFDVPGEQEIPRLSHVALWGSIVALSVGIVLLAGGRSLNLDDWNHALKLGTVQPGQNLWEHTAFWLVVGAIFLRKGIWPFHSWIVTSFERGPLLPLSLLVNGHLGAFLVVRIVLPMLPDMERVTVRILGDLGLLTAAYTAVLALVESQPRRILALLSVSQASFLLVGLSSTNADGVSGALIHWQVVSVATTILAAVFTGLEARVGRELDNTRYLGLACAAPRLAVFFVMGGLPLIGLPLTLGFCAEDLLLHGTLATHPHLGFIMPVVTAFNAFSFLRLFARLFLGRPGTEVRGMSDALPRERWVLTTAALFLVIGGLFPSLLLRLPTAAAERLTVPPAPEAGLHAHADR